MSQYRGYDSRNNLWRVYFPFRRLFLAEKKWVGKFLIPGDIVEEIFGAEVSMVKYKKSALLKQASCALIREEDIAYDRNTDDNHV